MSRMDMIARSRTWRRLAALLRPALYRLELITGCVVIWTVTVAKRCALLYDLLCGAVKAHKV